MKVLRWCIQMALLILPCAGALGAPTVGELIRDGNGLYESGDFAAALEMYTEAAKLDPGALEPLFNQACALYRLGRLAEASDALRRVESAPDRGSANDEMRLSTAARYNLGRIAMDLARQKLESDPSAALAHLREAERSFRRVLDEVPGDEDAARNLELARRSIRTVEQLIQQMQSLREQFSQQQEQAAEQFARLAERQRQAAERSRELEQQQQNAPSDQPPGQLPERMQEAEQEQESISRQTQDLARALDQIQQMLDQQQQISPEQREAAEQAIDDAIAFLEEAMDDQAAAEQALQERRPADAGEAQQQAADRIQDALEQLAAAAQQQLQQQTPQQGQGEEQRPSEEQPAVEQEGRDPQEAGDLPDEQELEGESASDGALEGPAQDIAQQILDREQRNREVRRAAAGRSGARKSVEKDW